jgi:thiol:disulfide interchange protein DsbG
MKLAHIAVAITLAVTFNLTGCSKPDAPAVLANPYETIAAQAKGFTVGALMSAHTVYVLFDPQCPHCGHLWEASAPLQNKAKFVWIPVAIVNAKSGPQGAALLSASNPVEAMTAHEKSILAGTGGMSASASPPRDIELAIKANTTLFNGLGADSVPFIIAKNAKTGLVVSNVGAMDTLPLAAFLGLN